jgi:SAM-dependent methyltransferase
MRRSCDAICILMTGWST